MSRLLQKIIFALISFLIMVPSSVMAVQDTITVSLTVNSCNENTVCEASLGETASNCPTDCLSGEGGGGGGGGPGPTLIDLSISGVTTIPATVSALIAWDTNLSSTANISWGRTLDYELGVISEFTPSFSHSVTVEGLSPDTSYFFKIEATETGRPLNTANSFGNKFTTLTADSDPPPANPSDFTTFYRVSSNDIRLTWTNPRDSDFDVVRILRSTTFFSTDSSDGLLIYEGGATSFNDVDVLAGKTYYYTIFARDASGQYSSGAVSSEFVPESGTEKDIEGKKDEEKGGGSEIEKEVKESPFEELPPATETFPEIRKLSFVFSQDGKTSLIFSEGGRLTLDGRINTTIYTNYVNFPEILKTIAVSLQHPKDQSKIFSFILKVNADKTRYSGIIGPLLDPGEYVTTIYLVDHKYSRLAKVKGSVFIPAPVKKNLQIITRAIPEKLAPIGSAVGIISGVTETLIITTGVQSVYDVYLIFVRFAGAILGFLGLRRKRKPWGTVYDAVTKRPIDPAYLIVTKDGKDVTEAITDLDGRYGFLLPSGTYKIKADKTNYIFPSKNLVGKTVDELYSNLYFGEEILTVEGEVITRNIPLDPIGFDWNEFVKNKQALFRLYSRRERFKTIIFDSLYLIGFVSTVFSTIISPSTLNFGILFLYVALFVFHFSWKTTFKAVTIKSLSTNEPYPFAIVRVFTARLNQEIKRVVTDRLGRFYLLVSPGKYYFTVDAKQEDSSYKRVYRSPELYLQKGILKDDVLIDRESFNTGIPLAVNFKI